MTHKTIPATAMLRAHSSSFSTMQVYAVPDGSEADGVPIDAVHVIRNTRTTQAASTGEHEVEDTVYVIIFHKGLTRRCYIQQEGVWENDEPVQWLLDLIPSHVIEG